MNLKKKKGLSGPNMQSIVVVPSIFPFTLNRLFTGDLNTDFNRSVPKRNRTVLITSLYTGTEPFVELKQKKIVFWWFKRFVHI